MTGPTDAPPPEDDGGADDELREFLDSEYFAEMSDDMLLDEVSRGVDHRTISDDMPDEEWALQDKLHDWRDDVEDVPLPPKLDPEAIIAEHLRHTNPAEPPGPRSTSEGTPAPMAISEDAQRIRVVADSQSAQGAIQLANTNLGEVQISADRLTDAVGVLQEAADGIANDANTAASAAGSGDDEMALRGAGEQARQAFEAAMAAAEAARSLCDQAATAVQQALQVCSDAAAADQQFRQTCSDVAGRHGA